MNMFTKMMTFVGVGYQKTSVGLLKMNCDRKVWVVLLRIFVGNEIDEVEVICNSFITTEIFYNLFSF